MLSKRGPGWFLHLVLSASDALDVVFVMATCFALTVSYLQLLFMLQPKISLLIARWSFVFLCIPRRSFNLRREPSYHGLACLLRLWDIPSPSGAGLPFEDAQFQALSQGRYQE
jgi:hypothetical protein